MDPTAVYTFPITQEQKLPKTKKSRVKERVKKVKPTVSIIKADVVIEFS